MDSTDSTFTEFSTGTETWDNVTGVYENVTSNPYWEQLPFAHKYWRQFNIEDIPDEYHHAVAMWMTFFGIVGVLGNLLVVYTFIRAPRLRTPPNMLIVNLALSDMSFSAINGFPLLTISSINQIWPWGHLCCQLYGYAGGLFGILSIDTLAFIALDRYYVVTRPLQVARKMTKKKSAVYIVIIWIWSLLWATPPLFGWGRYLPEGFQTSCTYDYLTQDWNNITFIIGMYVGAFVLPVGIIVFCYVGIVKALFKHHAEMLATAKRMGATTTKADADRQQEIQAAKVAAISVASFMLSWTPYAAIALLGMIFPHEDKMITPYMSEIPVMFAKASAAYNPIIYAISHPKYRAEIDKRFPWLLCCCKPKPSSRPGGTGSVTLSRTTSVVSRSEAESVVDVAMTPKREETTAANPAANPAAP